MYGEIVEGSLRPINSEGRLFINGKGEIFSFENNPVPHLLRLNKAEEPTKEIEEEE